MSPDRVEFANGLIELPDDHLLRVAKSLSDFGAVLAEQVGKQSTVEGMREICRATDNFATVLAEVETQPA